MTDVRRLRLTFDALLEIDAAQRAAWLDTQVVTDEERAALAGWLAADGAAGFLDRPLAEHLAYNELHASEAEPDAGAEALIGSRFGAFRLVRLLGQGGMATVFLATREGSDFSQDVALKLLRSGLHDPTSQRLFRRERSILARLEHPDIARLIDGGVSAEGIPYLAMELVDGVPIDRWCRDNALSTSARLRLFLRVCAAVDAAHRALVVHRDLKPSNILVTRSGQVKVLDFGIAFLLDADSEERTETGIRRMTPIYAAPEQVSGGAVTLATDVHALGVLMAELLLGARPTLAQGVRSGLRLPGKLRAELQWIFAKATAVEPAQRYRSAAELADDVARWLDGRPVLAHPPSQFYALVKLLLRHRLAFAIAALIALLLALSATLSWRAARRADAEALRANAEAQRANTAAETANAAQDFMVSLFENAKGELPSAQLPSSRELLERGLQRLRDDETTAPAVVHQLLGRFVDIYRNLNELERADEVSGWQLVHAREHFGVDSLELALARGEAGRNARRKSQWDVARAEFEAALPVLRRELPGSSELAVLLSDLGLVMTGSSRFDAADPYFAEAQTLLEPYCLKGQAQACRDMLAVGINAAVNLAERGDRLGARVRLLALLPKAKQHLGARHATVAQLHYNIAAASNGLGDADVAVEHARLALELSLALGPTARVNAANARNVLALAQAFRGEWGAAAVELETLVAETKILWPDGHADLALYRANLADQLISLGRYAEASVQSESAAAWYRQAIPADRFGIAKSLEQAARIAEAQDDLAVALQRIVEAVALREQAPGQRVDRLADSLLMRGRIELQMGQPAAALQSAQAAAALAAQGDAFDPRRRAAAAELLFLAGQPAEAERIALAVVEEVRSKPNKSARYRCEVALSLSTVIESDSPVAACAALVATLSPTAPLARAYARAMAR